MALVIACGKAFLVAGYFMHLISERKMIYGILAFTVFFFVGLMGLTLWRWVTFRFTLSGTNFSRRRNVKKICHLKPSM